MIVLAYIPLYLSLYNLFCIITEVFIKPSLPNIRVDVYSQYFLGIFHVQGVLLYRTLYAYYTHETWLRDHSISFTLAFFLFDTFFILLKDRSQRMYIPHHILSIAMCLAVEGNAFDDLSVLNLIFYAEASNVFLSLWEISRKNKLIPLMNRLYDLTTPFFAITYLPIRTIVLPVSAYFVLSRVKSFHGPIWFSVLFVLILSLWYSTKVWKILVYKVQQYKICNEEKPSFIDRIYMTLKSPNYKWWPIGTYIFKVYLNIYYLYHVIPGFSNVLPALIIIAIDFVHIFISFLYNIYDHAAIYEKLDYLSINYKICVSGLALYIQAADPSLVFWKYCIMATFITLFISTLSVMNKRKVPFDLMENKAAGTIFYSLPFVLTTFPIMYRHPFEIINFYTSFSMYIIGFVLWIFRVPEVFCPKTLFNSVGWLHVFVILGDVFLFNIF